MELFSIKIRCTFQLVSTHFAYSRPDATAVLYVDQSLDQIRELIAE